MVKKLVLLTTTLAWVCLWYVLVGFCLFQIKNSGAPEWTKWAMAFGVSASVGWFVIQAVWLTYVFIDKRMK